MEREYPYLLNGRFVLDSLYGYCRGNTSMLDQGIHSTESEKSKASMVVNFSICRSLHDADLRICESISETSSRYLLCFVEGHLYFHGTRSSIYVLQGEINTTVYRWDCLWCYRSRHGVQLNESVRQSVLYKLTIKYLSIYNLYIDG